MCAGAVSLSLEPTGGMEAPGIGGDSQRGPPLLLGPDIGGDSQRESPLPLGSVESAGLGLQFLSFSCF